MATVQNGVLIPSVDEINQIIAQWQTDMVNNDERRAKFKADSTGYFQNLGITPDVLRELLIDGGVQSTKYTLPFCGICGTCVFTNCVITSWRASVDVVLVPFNS